VTHRRADAALLSLGGDFSAMRHAPWCLWTALPCLVACTVDGAHGSVVPSQPIAAQGVPPPVELAPPAPSSVQPLLGTWYLRDQGLRRIARLAWDAPTASLRASLAEDTPFEDQASRDLEVRAWDPSGALSLRRVDATDGTADWYELRAEQGVLTGRVATHVDREVTPAQADYAGHVTGWNLAAMDDASPQRTWDLLLDGRERATLRIDRAPGGVTAYAGTLKVYATLARGIEDEGPERDLGVLRWDGERLEFFTMDDGVRTWFSATVTGRHLHGQMVFADGSVTRMFAGVRRDVLGYGLAPRGAFERDRWARRARAQVARMIMAGNPTPLRAEVTPVREGLAPLIASQPNPTRDDAPQRHESGYALSERRILSTLPTRPDVAPVKRETRVFVAQPEGPRPPNGWPVAVVANGHWGSAWQTFIPNSPYWYGDAFARRGHRVIAVDISHRPLADRGGRYADLPDGDAPAEGNGTHPAIREDARDSDWEEDGERAWDVMRALDLVWNDPDIDRARVTLVGLSMGGEVASIAGALDTRFTAVIPAGFSPDVAVYQFRQHACWAWAWADVNEYLDVSDYQAMIAPRVLVVETGIEDPAYSVAAQPFAADKQVLRRTRAAFTDMPERVVHFLHPNGHSFQVGDLGVFGEPGFGLTAPRVVAPTAPWSVTWQTDPEAAPVAATLFEFLDRAGR
jgi:dienelactone hydrolase